MVAQPGAAEPYMAGPRGRAAAAPAPLRRTSTVRGHAGRKSTFGELAGLELEVFAPPADTVMARDANQGLEPELRKRNAVGMLAALALLALPATTMGDRAGHGAERRGLGALIAHDSARDNPAAAVAQTTLQRGEMGKVSYRITTVPNRTKVDWGVTVRCMRGFLIDYFPGPGDFKTGTRPGGFGGTFRVPLKDPDYCTFAVAGQTFEHDAGKRDTVKIYNKGRR